MPTSLRIGIIGGNGWLGSAIAGALLEAGAVDAARLTLSKRANSPRSADIFGVCWTFDNAELVDRSDVVIVSVRPEQFAAIDVNAQGKLVVSVMAGVSVATLQARTNADRIVRAMPNAAASLRKSFTPWFANAATSAQDKSTTERLLSACGEAAEVPRESDIEYCAGMTGSGAAFSALLAQAMREAALSYGFSPEFARRAAVAIVADASQLLRADGADPAEIVQEMIDYRGTTAAALEAMGPGLKEAVRAGLAAAASKALELSKAQGR